MQMWPSAGPDADRGPSLRAPCGTPGTAGVRDRAAQARRPDPRVRVDTLNRP